MFEEIWSSVKRNKLRTALTGFAVAWGIFMLIVLLGAGNGLLNATRLNSGNFLSNSMMVGSGTTTKSYDGYSEGRHFDLNEADVETTGKSFKSNIDMITAQIERQGLTVVYGQQYVSSSMNGVYPDYAVIEKVDMLCGRFVNLSDMRESRKVAVLSQNQAKELLSLSGNGTLAEEIRRLTPIVGKTVKIGSINFTVVGVYKSDMSGMSNSIYIPYTTMRGIFSGGDVVENINFSFHGLDTEEQNEAFEKNYKSTINQAHHAAPDDDGAIWIWNRFTNNMQMNKGMNILNTALWIIGLLTLVSGVVGVSNIMLISVKERTHEFGIRKALGATPASILWLIVAESIIITTFFGYIGMLLGIAATEYMNVTMGAMQMDAGVFKFTTFVNPTVGLGVCIQATLTLIVAGTLAGLIPARKAANIRPIEALRYE